MHLSRMLSIKFNLFLLLQLLIISNTSPTSYNKQLKWFNSNIQHHIKCLRTLRRKLNKCPTENKKKKYEDFSNLLQAKINPAKANYESDLIIAFVITIIQKSTNTLGVLV